MQSKFYLFLILSIFLAIFEFISCGKAFQTGFEISQEKNGNLAVENQEINSKTRSPNTVASFLSLEEKAMAQLAGEFATDEQITEEEAISFLTHWALVQNEGNFSSYASCYASGFNGIKRVGEDKISYTRDSWLEDRKKMFNYKMKVDVLYPQVIFQDKSAPILQFIQLWEGGSYKDGGTKILILSKQIDEIKIIYEEMINSYIINKELQSLADNSAPYFVLENEDNEENEKKTIYVIIDSIIDAPWVCNQEEVDPWKDTSKGTKDFKIKNGESAKDFKISNINKEALSQYYMSVEDKKYYYSDYENLVFTIFFENNYPVIAVIDELCIIDEKIDSENDDEPGNYFIAGKLKYEKRYFTEISSSPVMAVIPGDGNLPVVFTSNEPSAETWEKVNVYLENQLQLILFKDIDIPWYRSYIREFHSSSGDKYAAIFFQSHESYFASTIDDRFSFMLIASWFKIGKDELQEPLELINFFNIDYAFNFNSNNIPDFIISDEVKNRFLFIDQKEIKSIKLYPSPIPPEEPPSYLPYE